MAALYAFARHTDDLGDSDQPAAVREKALAEWRRMFAEGFSQAPRGPILPAVVDAVYRFQIPQQFLVEIMDGVAMDLHHQGFETFDELRHYCYYVASAVGLACLHIWGFENESAVREPAIQCGVAFQLTNILRDLREDAANGRVYLPREDLKRFDFSQHELRHHKGGDQFDELIRFQIERAERYYCDAAETVSYLHADGRRMFSMMFNTYRGLLKKIAKNPRAVLHTRVRLTFSQKLRIAVESCVKGIS